jgi:hypothetical protein
VGGRSLAIILIGSILDVHHRQWEQEFLVGGVTEFNMKHEDPID